MKLPTGFIGTSGEFSRVEAARLRLKRLVEGIKNKEPWALAEADANPARERIYALAGVKQLES